MKTTSSLFAAVGALFVLAGSAASAQSEDLCEAPRELDTYQLLRRLSLDLRGRAPTFEEYQALEAAQSLPAGLVQEWLGTDDFRQMMRRYHEALLWPNVSNVRFANVNARLRAATFGALSISSSTRRNNYRGSPDVTSALGEQCGDYEQTHFDPAYPNQFRPDPAFIQKTAAGDLQEGWRWVEPFWAPGTQVKVCAFDAQQTPEVTVGTRTLPCSSTEADGNKACGCGPNLAWCYAPSAADVDNPIRNALREQLNRSVDEVTVGGKPYTDLILSSAAWQNGPIAHWKRYLASHYSLSLTYNVADPQEQLLDRGFTDTTWTRVERGGQHAGVLTLPAFLLRFQTNRARANRFRIAFECEYFVPPAQLPENPGCSNSSDDLQARCGCQYCHQTLEPLAARFGQFAEAGTTHLTDKIRFPDQSTPCTNNPNSGFCRRFYVSEPGAHRLGWLMPLQFADVYPELETAFLEGPRGRARAVIESGSFARCTVRNVFRHLVKRDLRLQGATADELELLQSLSEGFAQSGYSLPWLVEQVVSLPQYRRIH